MKGGLGLIYTIVMIGLLCLFIFSEEPFEEERPRLHRRHLPGTQQSGGRVQHMHESVAFDPLVAEIDRRRENVAWKDNHFIHRYRTWAQQAQMWVSPSLHGKDDTTDDSDILVPAKAVEPQPSPWDDFNFTEFEGLEEYAGEDYLNSENFNISHRLEVLFPLIDINPIDGFVSLTELQHWQELSALRVTHQSTDRDMEIHDLNKDGFITLSEYVPHITSEDVEKNDLEVGGAGWWMEQFQNADEDGNGVLNRSEFHEFLHPEDSRVEKIHHWLIRQELKSRSVAHGWNLTWQDFHQNVFDVIRDYGAEESAPELAHLNPYRDMEARKQILSRAAFLALDANQDGFLTEDEAESIISRLRPGELYYARFQAEQLVEQADDDKDGRLTLEEMLIHPYVFYNTAYDHGDQSAYSHDEF